MMAAQALADPDAVILDLETTDLDGYVVEVAVIDMAGLVLLNSRVEPQWPIEVGAARIHGITEVGLVGAPTFAQIAEELTALLVSRRVWTYNASFDSAVLEREVERLAQEQAEAGLLHDHPSEAQRFARQAARTWCRQMHWRCAMGLYATFAGEWSKRYKSYRYQRLPGGDHSALGDALAALEVLRRVAVAGVQLADEQEQSERNGA